MSALPTGVVTFLFTDVVGSVGLWERDPAQMLTCLQRHERMIIDAVEAHGGHLLRHKGEGDSTFSVFASPAQAVAAAVDAQRALRAHPWPEATPITVRCSVHTGEAVQQGADYFGTTTNRAARIRALAGAGEILVSGTTASLVGSQMPDGATFRYRRSEMLRGVSEPIEIHEVVYAHDEVTVVDDEPVTEDTTVPVPARLRDRAAGEHAGRRWATDLAEEAAAEAAAGSPRILLFGGEPGVGKTDLCSDIAARRRDAGWNVLLGSCGPELVHPYGPFVEALTPLVTHGPRSVLADHAVRHGGELGRLFPQLDRRIGEIAPTETADGETARLLLVDALTDLVVTAARERPLVLILDDLHWADNDSLLVLRHLARFATDTELLVLGTYRTVEAGDDARFAAVLPELARSPLVRIEELTPLAEDGVLELLSLLAGHELVDDGAALASYLERATGGNPFFIVEVLRHFSETGVVTRGPEGRWRLSVDLAQVSAPGTVREVILGRVRRLGEPCMTTLTVAAAVGDEFRLDVLAAVLDGDEDAVFDQLERAVHAALLVDLGQDRFRFAHALVSQTLAEQQSASRRARHHRRIAAVLAELRPDDPAAVAGQLLAAGGADDRAEAIGWVLRAGRAALEALAPADAARWFRRGVDELDGHLDTGERAEMLIGLGTALEASDVAGARAALLEAASVAREEGEVDLLVRAALANDRGDTAAAGVIDTEQIAMVEDALAALGEVERPERAILLARLAIDLVYEADPSRRLEAAAEAEAIARRLDDPVTLARVLVLTTEATRLPDTHHQRDKATAELLELAERIDDPVLLGMASLRRSRFLWEAGRVGEAERCTPSIVAAAPLRSLLRWDLEVQAANRAQLAGDLGAAQAHALAAMELAMADNQPDALPVYASQVFSIAWDSGTLAEIEPLIVAAVAENPLIPAFRGVLAVIYCEMDRFDEARALVEPDVAGDYGGYQWNTLWLTSMALLAEVAYQVRDTDMCATLHERLLPFREQHVFSGVSRLGAISRYLGQLGIVLGDLDGAEADLQLALDDAARMSAPIDAARARLARAELLATRGTSADRTEARRELELVLVDAEPLGTATIARRARERLAALGSP